MACRVRTQVIGASQDGRSVCSDARGRRYAAAALSDCSRPRPAPHSSSARYRRPTTRALRLRPHPSSPATTSTAAASLRILRAATAARPRGGCALVPAHAPARQPLPPPARERASTTSACSPVRIPACQQAGQFACPRAESHPRPAASAAAHPPAHLLHALSGAHIVLERTAGGTLLDGVFGALRGCGVAVQQGTDRRWLTHPRLRAGRAARAARSPILLQQRCVYTDFYNASMCTAAYAELPACLEAVRLAHESGERAARVHAMALCAPGHSSRHSSACAPACMLMQPPTQPPACKPPPRLPISRLLAWVAASVVTNQL